MNRRAKVALAVVMAVALAGAGVAVAESGGATLTPAEATRQWAAANSNQFAAAVRALLRDANWVRRGIAGNDAAVRTYCLYLYSDAEGANTDLLTTPDGQLTELLSGSLDGFVQASAVCDDHSASAAALHRVDDEVTRSVLELTEAVLREEAVTGSSLGIKGIP
jgi:hypothetical protein